MTYERGCSTSSSAGRGTGRTAACLTVLLLSGCMSSGPAPNSIRTTAQTAPADLQLACASAAATALGVDSSAVLPVSSSQIDAQSYQVELNAKGARATCVVDTTGNVRSVQKA
jgi:hypothetical protein